MPKTSRREFLGCGGSLLLGPFLAEQVLGEPASLAAAPLFEPEWREPGQTKDAEYLRTAALRYSAEDREIVGHNRTCFNNRPLYCQPGTDGVVLAGDRPFLRLLANPYVLGGFSAAIVRDGAGKWFHEYSQVESRYHCGRMSWRISDSALVGVSVTLDAVPMAGVAGFALQLQATGLRGEDKLVWAFGGARSEGDGRWHWDPNSSSRSSRDVRWHWDPIMRESPKTYKLGDPRKPAMSLVIDPESCAGNRVAFDDQAFRLFPTANSSRVAVGKTDGGGFRRVVDASAAGIAMKLSESTGGELPMVGGVIDLRAGEKRIFWAIQEAPADGLVERLQIATPAQAFREGVSYLESIERVRIKTPDPRLDAAVAAVCHAIDSSCDRNPYVFRHGCMAFFIRFLGWRVICGATALGWHERVKGDVAYYAPFQVKDGEGRSQAESDSGRRYCIQGSQSRFYGRGRIAQDTHMYNTQSQFFDQIIHDWRWTGDTEMERILRPALELHLEWAKDCFDPDDDGLYESYINTLPTDSVWYNGGGSVEESAYAYSGHVAAMQMARRAGDTEAASRHQQRAEKIKRALNEVLWLNDRGQFGLYREQGGHGRVHADAWVYSEFLPIDARIATTEQAVQALYYTEWGLERIRLPFGGEVCQPSNWVPWKWSVRDVFGGDVCALALGYFQTGLSEEGWDLLLGATLESAYASAVPGGFSQIGAGTDFADSCHMFARTVVEGLFGYDPDYPSGLVRMRPALPSAWPKASIRTPDYAFDYRQEGNTDHYRLTVEQEAKVDFRLPVRAERVDRVTLNGQDIKWSVEAGFGCTWVRIRTGKLQAAELAIELTGRVPQSEPVTLAGKVGEEVRLVVPQGQAVRWHDFHEVIEAQRSDGSMLHGFLASKPGHHMLQAEVKVGELPQWQLFKLKVSDPAGEARRVDQSPREAPKGAHWVCLDLAPYYNGDIKTIFQQQYLSPRPPTCSVRLGVDGYSAWTFPFWKESVPVIDLDHLNQLTDSQGRIMTSQNVPFHRIGAEQNTAFTSLWDNWPRSVTAPINQRAETAWLLVCGTTFPMQTRIANAEIRFHYSDGQVEKLELIPPLNFWTLCPWGGEDYNYALDAFCLPPQPPPTVQLGRNCRAMVLSWKLRPDIRLKDITLETLSQDVVIGLMGISLMNPKPPA